MPFTFHKLDLPGLTLVEPKVFGDSRGFFKEGFKSTEFAAAGLPANFVQENWSRSAQNVLRGLHYQVPPRAQGKLVGVASGRIYDVAVDIRNGSPTFGKWYGVELNEDYHKMLWVPEGFAHGFCVLSASADVVYRVTDEYAPESERGVAWNDPAIGVEWPVQGEPLLSDKDKALPPLELANLPFDYNA